MPLPALDGEAFTPDSPGYEAVRRPVHPAYREVRPRLVVRCRSVADVVATVRYAAAVGERVVPRGGGHCFAGRSSTTGIVLDTSGLDGVTVAGSGVATVGAGARLGQVYAALHAHGRTLPAGCGRSVGIAGLTLGGGIGLLGRRYGLTCDRLTGARVVLPGGDVVDCDGERHPDLFWALRGAGGGQFGVVTSLRFDTVPEPATIRVQARLSGTAVEELAAAWQAWAPDAPDGLTVNLTLECEPGAPVRATLFGASTLDEAATRELLRGLTGHPVTLAAAAPYHRVKLALDQPEPPGRVERIRSELFSRALSGRTLAALLSQLAAAPPAGRRLAFTALGGAYNRVAEDATAFAHRGARFLLEHAGDATDPWVDSSWATAHAEGSGRVYPNFPDPALADWATAYHAGNHARLVTIRSAYDPHRFFDFPQAV